MTTQFKHTVINTQNDARRPLYEHSFSYGDRTFRRLDIRPQASKFVIRLAKEKLFQNNRSNLRKSACQLGSYYPEKWARLRKELTIRRASLNVAKSILGFSKAKTRKIKMNMAYEKPAHRFYYKSDRVTVPYFGSCKVNEYNGKFANMLHVKRHAAKYPPTVYPDFIRFEVETKTDDYADTSDLGEFTDRWEPGAINHFAKQYGYDGQSSNTCKWFIPAQTYADVRRDLIEMNMGKTDADRLAREYVERDYKRAATYGDHWSMYCMTVTAYVGNTEIGSASLFGIESDSGDYLAEVERELKDEALANIDLDDIKAQAAALDQLIDYCEDEDY